MIANDTIKAALVTKVKGITAATDILAEGASGVKEAQYQGSDYAYPATRVQIVRQTPRQEMRQCDVTRMFAIVRAYAEGPSSQPCDDLAGKLNDGLHRQIVRGGTIGTDAFYIPELLCTGLIGAVRLNERLWRSEIMVEGNVYPSDDMGGN